MPSELGGRVGNVAGCWGVVLEHTVVSWGRRVIPDELSCLDGLDGSSLDHDAKPVLLSEGCL
jgi:hypothetical protein